MYTSARPPSHYFAPYYSIRHAWQTWCREWVLHRLETIYSNNTIVYRLGCYQVLITLVYDRRNAIGAGTDVISERRLWGREVSGGLVALGCSGW